MNIQPEVPFTLNDDWYVILRTILPEMVSETASFLVRLAVRSARTQCKHSILLAKVERSNGFDLGKRGRSFCCRPERMSCSAPGNGPRVRPGLLSGRAVAGRLAFSPGTTGLSLATPTAPMSTKTFLQPVLAYTTSRAWTFTLQGEDTYNWETGEWLAPVNFRVSKIVKVGGSRSASLAACAIGWTLPTPVPMVSAAVSG